jgi:glycosyltransferase involved in cell wall biosynthesis
MPPERSISVIIPLYNERENIRPLHDSLVDILAGVDMKHEIIYVDDGSEDGTFERLGSLDRTHTTVRIIRFNRNFGQTQALRAGFGIATGDICITMDGDLQNDAADIPLLVAKIEEGYDLVSGWRKQRKERGFLRKLLSRIANILLARITGIPLHDYGCTLKAYRRDAIDDIPLYGEMHRFIPAIASLKAIRITELEVRHHYRRHGRSKYGLSRIWKVLFDMVLLELLIRFEGKPFHPFALAGTIPLILGIYFTIIGMHDLFHPRFPYTPVIHFGMSFLFLLLSCHLVVMGFICELIVFTGMPRISKSTRNWPADPSPVTGGTGRPLEKRK